MGSALGQAHWPPPQAGATSGRWPTVPGVTHLIACAQVGPIRTPGGPPNPRGRVPHQRLSRALVTPAPPRWLRCLSLPSCFRPQGRPPVPRPLPCPLAPAMPRLPVLSAPALACWCPLLLFFFFPSPAPPPMSPRCLLAVIALFVGGWRSMARGGGGVLAVPPIAQARRKHGAGTRRGTCPSAGGEGACRVASAVTLPFLRLHPWWSPRWGLHGACSLWARSCGSSRTLVPVPPHPAAAPSGGGSASRYRHPPCPLDFPSLPSPLSSVGVGVGGGVGGAPSLPFLRCKHVAGTALARGAALVLVLGSGARRVAPVFALPTLRSLPRCPPRRGPHGACFPWARSCGPSRTLSPPSPLLAALSSGGGAAVRPSLPASPTLGGAEARGGGGGACHFPFVALMSQARGAASLCRGGGGGARLVAPVVALSTLRPPSRWSPRRGLHGTCPLRARSFGSSRHCCLPTLPRCPRGGGGGACRLPLIRTPRPRGGGDGWGGGGAPFSSPLRCTHVAGKT